MRSRFSILGHPLHPILVSVPIGLFVWAFIADLVYVFSDNQTWYDIAFWSGVSGVIAALVAALPGLGDYLTIAVNSDANVIATAHMALNIAVVVLFTVAAGLAVDDGATSGSSLTAVVVIHAVGVGLLGIAGALGGEMVYRHHLGMIPDGSEDERAERERHGEVAWPR
ncbi:MAG TPA: DUF2231 domain-containing protein [Dehalococcoidia bacterium]|jgi:uncharacterized membrane protein|nr:DUF2231 domain-containing protein [Dehalococcoidia bacterium]